MREWNFRDVKIVSKRSPPPLSADGDTVGSSSKASSRRLKVEHGPRRQTLHPTNRMGYLRGSSTGRENDLTGRMKKTWFIDSSEENCMVQNGIFLGIGWRSRARSNFRRLGPCPMLSRREDAFGEERIASPKEAAGWGNIPENTVGEGGIVTPGNVNERGGDGSYGVGIVVRGNSNMPCIMLLEPRNWKMLATTVVKQRPSVKEILHSMILVIIWRARSIKLNRV